MASDRHLTELMLDALSGREGVEPKKMFGGTCWMLNGNMLCGDGVGQFMFRVGKDQESEALAKPGTEPVVFSGRKMGGIIWVEEKQALEDGLDYWIGVAENFVGALPPK